MAIVLLRVNVAYPTECRGELEKHEARLKEAGMLAGNSAVLADAHNIIYFMLSWQSVESARQFWSTPDGKKVLDKLKSVENPEVLFLEEAK